MSYYLDRPKETVEGLNLLRAQLKSGHVLSVHLNLAVWQTAWAKNNIVSIVSWRQMLPCPSGLRSTKTQ
jgi:hypothetical protein